MRAVIHSHAPALTATGIRGLDLAAELPELPSAVGRIVTVPFAPSGSEEMGKVAGGDTLGADILGAKNAGIGSVWSLLSRACPVSERRLA